jgi:hypothetical protein
MCHVCAQVDVFLPGFHTHGTIIVRRDWDRLGEEVSLHCCARMHMLL